MIRFAAIALALFPASLAAQVQDVPTVQGFGPWTVNQHLTRCTIERRLGASDTPYVLTLARHYTPLGVTIEVQAPNSSARLRSDRVTLQSDTIVQESTSAWNANGRSDEPDVSGHFDSLAAFPADARQATITVMNGRRQVLRLEFGGLGAALAALQSCQDRLYAAIGIDAAAMRRVAVNASPAGDARRWATADDLPREFENLTTPLTSWTVLEIGATGRVTRCTIVQSSTQALLDFQACRVLTARARFHPARDATGHAVATAASRNVRWQAWSQ